MAGKVVPLAQRGGRVVAIGHGQSVSTARAPAAAASSHGMGILLLTLPMFEQVFHYMVDVAPLYYLSKAWPIMMLPLTLHCIVIGRSRFATNYLLALVYVMSVTPILSMLWLGNTMVDALANSIKVWPLTYYFSMLSLLNIVKPSAETLIKALVRLGLGTMIVMWMMWVLVPSSVYIADGVVSKLFLTDNERGNRIYFPMTFAMIAMFYATMRGLRKPQLWQALVIGLGLATQLIIFKQRTATATCVLILAGMVFFRMSMFWRMVSLMGAVGGAAVGVMALLAKFDKVAASLGGSLTVRQHSMELLEHYLASEPLRWVVGVGAASRTGSVTMTDIMGNKNFFLADLGWAGVLFEFGLAGTMILMALYLTALRWSWRLPVLGDFRERAMIGALTGYVGYLAVSSVIYPIFYAPGELASTVALLLYLVNITEAKETAITL